MDEDKKLDFTLKYFSIEEHKFACNNCDDIDDGDSEKKRFFHIMKYCNHYDWQCAKLYSLK